VAYFSCTGTTERLAKALSAQVGADLYRIEPATPYTPADLNWRDDNSRSSVEMRDPQSRPGVAGEPLDLIEYDVIYLGAPIWWGVPPTIVNTFLETHDFSGKTIVPFVTSGSSGVGETDARLRASCSEQTGWRPATRLDSATSPDQLRLWAESA
jgi:flavodoxin